MIAQYVDNVYDDSYLPTISDSKSKFLTFRGQNYEIQISDTAGQVKKNQKNQRKYTKQWLSKKTTRLNLIVYSPLLASFSFFR